MCRIAGVVSSMPPEQSLEVVRKMLNAMARGGPDDEGTYQNGSVCLGHRRLAIIDLSSAGHQPMKLHDDRFVISYNGEIYNYRELREELQKAGSIFKTSTDTEVIAEGYRRWGVRVFAKLIGMFALVIHDTANNKIVMARDSAGIKPLYYSVRGNTLLFASQVKAFSAQDKTWPQDERWRQLFLSFGFLPHPYTTLKDVTALGKGCYAEVDIQNPVVKAVDYSNDVNYRKSGNPINVTTETTWNALRRHLISDAPLGVFLSGGIDSSLLTLMASKESGDQLRTISINFSDATFDESKYQNMILDIVGHNRHKSFVVSETMLWDSMDDIWDAMDQPTIDGVNSYFVSQAAHRSGLKAVLSGLGADEIFGGYESFARVRWLGMLRSTMTIELLVSMATRYKDAYRRLAFLRIDGPVGDHLFLRGIHVPSVTAKMLNLSEKEVWQTLGEVPSSKPSGMDHIQYASWLEREYYMTSQLLKDTDCMSMHFGLEARVPFLDQELVSIVQSIGARERISRDQPKYLLTKAFEDMLPPEIVFRKKQGFTFPFATWLTNRLRNGAYLKSIWNDNAGVQTKFINGAAHWTQYWSGVVLSNFTTTSR